MSLVRTYRDLFARNPSLAWLLTGEFVSGIGDWLYLVAILVVIYSESSSAVLLGIVGAARILPYVLLSVPAGIVADRFDRRIVLLVTDVARGVIMLALAAVVVLDAPTLVMVALAIGAACFSTFFGPAIAALLPQLVDERDLGPANSAWATLDNVAFIIGPAVAGLILATSGLELAFLLNAASFAVVAVILWRLKVSPPATADAAEADEKPPAGWRDLAGPMRGPVVIDSANSLVSGGLGVLTVILAIDVLGAGEAGTGFLQAATGVGGVVAGVAGGALLARRLRVPLIVGGAVGGIGLAWLAVSGSLVVAMVAIAVAVAGLLLLDIVNTTLVQRSVPDELRGRAMGALQASSAVLYSLGSLVMPLAADVVGVPTVLVAGALLVAVGVGVGVVLTPSDEEPAAVDAIRLRALEHPIFAGLPAPRIEAAAGRLRPMPVAAGEAVVRQGDAADRFYVIDAGSFEVSQERDGERTTLRTLGPGDVFGEIGLLRGIPRTATVTATSDGLLYVLDAEPFAELVGSGPGLSTRLLDLYRGALSR